jgi:hypothetical protein
LTMMSMRGPLALGGPFSGERRDDDGVPHHGL